MAWLRRHKLALGVVLLVGVAAGASAAVTFRSAIPFGTASSWSSAVGGDPNAVRGPWYNANEHALFHTANNIDWQADNIVYSVQAFGCVGDGITDDTTCIQNTITAAEATGGVVYFPAATYLVSGVGPELFLATSQVTFQGAGWNSIIKLASTVPNTTDVIHVTCPTASNVGTILYNFHISATNGASKGITGASNTTPISITSAGHGYATGQVVHITGVTGNTSANGTWVITNTGVNTFTLNGSAGSAAYIAGGTVASVPGGNAINFDVQASGHQIQNARIVHVKVDQLGGRAFTTTNPTPQIDGIFVVDLLDNFFFGGINLSKAGDSFTMRGNTITGGFNAIDLDIITNLVPIAGGGGHMTIIDDNNVTSQGAFVRLVNANLVKITNNNVELQAELSVGADSSNAPNNATIDVDANVANPAYGLEVNHNFLSNFGKTGNVVRLNYSMGAVLEYNDCEPYSGPGPICYQITANAANNFVNLVLNESGQLPATQISDSGSRTTVTFRGNNGTEFGTSVATQNNAIFWGGTAQSGDIFKIQASDGTTEYLEAAANGHILVGGSPDRGLAFQVLGGGYFTASVTVASPGSLLTNNIDASSGGLVTVGAISNVQLGGGAPTATISLQGQSLAAIQAVSTSGSPFALKVQAAASTTLANAELNDLLFDMSASAQITGGGTIADMRTALLKRRTYTATAGTTFTEASTLYIDNAPLCSTNVTCTNTYALDVAAGVSLFGGSVTFAGGMTASGSNANDLSGGSGTFKTSTGVNTFGGSSNTFTNGFTITSGSETLSNGSIQFTTGGTGIDSAGQLNIGHTNANSILMGKSGATTNHSGSMRVIQGFAPGGFRTATSTITVAVTDGFVGVNGSGARTVNLPAASTCLTGQAIIIQDVGGTTGLITVNPNGTDNINGANSAVTMAVAFGKKEFYCDASTNWYTDPSPF